MNSYFLFLTLRVWTRQLGSKMRRSGHVRMSQDMRSGTILRRADTLGVKTRERAATNRLPGSHVDAEAAPRTNTQSEEYRAMEIARIANLSRRLV